MHHINGDRDVLHGDRLGRVVADTPLQRTNSIATGVRMDMTTASCPAPLGRLNAA